MAGPSWFWVFDLLEGRLLDIDLFELERDLIICCFRFWENIFICSVFSTILNLFKKSRTAINLTKSVKMALWGFINFVGVVEFPIKHFCDLCLEICRVKGRKQFEEGWWLFEVNEILGNNFTSWPKFRRVSWVLMKFLNLDKNFNWLKI